MQDSKQDSKKVFTQVLKQLNEKELKGFITRYCKTNVEMQNKFLTHFAYKIEDKPEEKYQIIIQNCIKACTNTRGYFLINYKKTNSALKPIMNLLKDEQNSCHAKPYDAFVLAKLIMENFGELIDSFYEIENFEVIDNLFYETLELLKIICESKSTPFEFKDEIFEYLLVDAQNPNFDRSNTYHDTQIDLDLLEIASAMCNKEQSNTLLKVLNNKIAQCSQYRKKYFLELKVSLLKKFEMHEELHKTIKDNMDDENIRDTLIQEALQKNELETAIKMIQEGKTLFEKKGLSGLASKYEHQLLELFKKHNMNEKYIELLWKLYTKDFEMNYYDLLKEYYPKDQWKQERTKIIQQIKTKNSYYPKERKLAMIYAKDDMQKELFELIVKCDSLDFLKSYAAYCKQSYAKEILDLYHQYILDELSLSDTRKQYSKLAYMLENIAHTYIGGKEFVVSVHKFIKRKYAKKPAMIEEMSILNEFDKKEVTLQIKTKQETLF